jgi:hypothetical protein
MGSFIISLPRAMASQWLAIRSRESRSLLQNRDRAEEEGAGKSELGACPGMKPFRPDRYCLSQRHPMSYEFLRIDDNGAAPPNL